MSFFEDLSKKIAATTQSATQKAKDTADIVKLNSQVNDLNKTIANGYAELGKQYFENNKDNVPEEFAEIFNSINESTAKIAELKDQIKTIKGISTCPSCGNDVPVGQKFCPNCGAQLPEVKAPEAPVAPVCPTCGEPVAEGQKFCSKCGGSIE